MDLLLETIQNNFVGAVEIALICFFIICRQDFYHELGSSNYELNSRNDLLDPITNLCRILWLF